MLNIREREEMPESPCHDEIPDLNVLRAPRRGSAYRGGYIARERWFFRDYQYHVI